MFEPNVKFLRDSYDKGIEPPKSLFALQSIYNIVDNGVTNPTLYSENVNHTIQHLTLMFDVTEDDLAKGIIETYINAKIDFTQYDYVPVFSQSLLPIIDKEVFINNFDIDQMKEMVWRELQYLNHLRNQEFVLIGWHNDNIIHINSKETYKQEEVNYDYLRGI